MITEFPPLLTIPKIKRINVPVRFIFVDTETQRELINGALIKHVLKVGSATYWQRETDKKGELVENKDFYNPLDFWEWVTSKIHARETIYLFAHNVTFDFLVMDGFRLLPCLGYTLQSLYYRFTTTVLRFHNGNHRLVIADSMNYFPVSLDKLGESVGIKKLRVDFNNVDDKTLLKRCRVDVSIVYKAVRTLVETTANKALGSFRPTSAAMASNIFRHSFMKHDIVTNHAPELVKFERSSYFGGYIGVQKLTERGSPRLYKLDVNAMYPSVMLHNAYPTRLMHFQESMSLDRLEYYLREYQVIATVVLHARMPWYPVRTTEGVVYPIGDFETTLTTPLLIHALMHDEIAEVKEVGVYLGHRIFDDYITYMSKQRIISLQDGDTATELFYKTLQSSLYGKFAQQQTENKVISDAPINDFAVFEAFDPENNEHWKELHAGGSVMFIYERGEARYTSYAIAAHVTDYARVKLFQLRDLAGLENVFYMDTDSLIVNDAGRANLLNTMHDLKLGMLKTEEEGRVFIGFAKKDYILGSARKLKGFSKDGVRMEGNVFKSLSNIGFYGAARRNLAHGAFWYEATKRYNPTLRNVNVEDDGRISPLRFPQEAGEIGRKIATYPIVKELVAKQFNSKERAMVAEWVS